MSKETALPKNIRQIGELQGREKICLEDYVMTCIRKKEPQEKDGYLGIFYGEQQETEDSLYVFIRGILELPKETEPERIKEEMEQQQRDYFPGWEVQGCCVIGQYPTERLSCVTEQIPEAGKLIYHLQEQEENLYWILEESYKRIKGYFIFYEQNRKMQRYLEDQFQEESVEKESLPDKAIRSFREKIQEKSEKKSAGMLRMAGSFFAVTVLALGAIAVTRLDDIRKAQTAFEREGSTIENEAPEEAGRIYMSDDAADAVSGNSIQSGNQTAMDAGVAMNADSDLDSYAVSAEQNTLDFEADKMTDVEADEVSGNNIQGGNQTAMDAGTNIAADPAAQPASAVPRKLNATYTIRSGDTLAEICSRYYGSLDKLEDICEANSITDANRIMPGQKLVLP